MWTTRLRAPTQHVPQELRAFVEVHRPPTESTERTSVRVHRVVVCEQVELYPRVFHPVIQTYPQPDVKPPRTRKIRARSMLYGLGSLATGWEGSGGVLGARVGLRACLR